MKNLTIILSLLILFTGCGPEQTLYCGNVTRLYLVETKYPQPRVVFYNDSLQRNIDIEVSFNTYSNMKEGQMVCFKLTDFQLRR